ncbi:MAG: hypoxanthine-guanine phosphoribosyltransferase [Oceanococcaceae bacterium]
MPDAHPGAAEAQARLSAAEELLPRCDTLVDAAELRSIYDRLAAAAAADLRGLHPLVICVMSGGLYATSEITQRWDFAFDLDYLQATRYRGQTSGGEILWKAVPGRSLAGRHVLVIDDVLDEGHTLVAVLEALRGQQPASLRTLVTCEKVHDHKHPEAAADYAGVQLPDRYLFGAGMDYHEAWRQLDHIVALPEKEDGH